MTLNVKHAHWLQQEIGMLKKNIAQYASQWTLMWKLNVLFVTNKSACRPGGIPQHSGIRLRTLFVADRQARVDFQSPQSSPVQTFSDQSSSSLSTHGIPLSPVRSILSFALGLAGSGSAGFHALLIPSESQHTFNSRHPSA